MCLINCKHTTFFLLHIIITMHTCCTSATLLYTCCASASPEPIHAVLQLPYCPEIPNVSGSSRPPFCARWRGSAGGGSRRGLSGGVPGWVWSGEGCQTRRESGSGCHTSPGPRPHPRVGDNHVQPHAYWTCIIHARTIYHNEIFAMLSIFRV